jgi:catechol 2,3-dioxygenase-like lactoylglutathione lyase family enzyme
MAAMIEHSAQRPALVEWWAMTIDCPEPQAMADFYVALLGGKVTRRTADEANVDAGGLLLNFRAVPDYRPPTWPSSEVALHSHFDFVVEDPDAVAQQMLQLGGSLSQHQDTDNPHLVVLLDPAGHPFCLLRSSVARRF